MSGSSTYLIEKDRFPAINGVGEVARVADQCRA